MPVDVDVKHPSATSADPDRYLLNIEQVLERCAPLAAGIIVFLFALWSWFASRGVQFRFDELLELAAATASSNGQVISSLGAGVDFNPPLSHFLVRNCLQWFGGAEWVARLPAFLGVTALLLCLYSLVSRQLSRSYGLIAMLVIVCLPVRTYAVQARPYGLLLGLTGVALVLYRRVTAHRLETRSSPRTLALAALAVCAAALVATHYYAVLIIAVLVAASLVRAWELQRLDWPLLACSSVPPAVVLVMLRHVIAQQRLQLTHYFAKGSLISFDHGFDDLLVDPLVCCTALILIVISLTVCSRQSNLRPLSPVLGHLSLDTVVLAIGLLSLPLIGAVVTQLVTHAYLTRYFAAASIGLAICICYGVRTFADAVPGLVLLLLIPLGLGFGKTILQEAHRAPDSVPSIDALTAESTPILFDTPEAYLQTYHYLPALRNMMWVIADPPAALRYRQYDTDDRIMLALATEGQAQAITLSAAAHKWSSFRLIPRSADYVWALKCVMDAGARISVNHSFTGANFIFSVDVLPQSVPLIEACGRQ